MPRVWPSLALLWLAGCSLCSPSRLYFPEDRVSTMDPSSAAPGLTAPTTAAPSREATLPASQSRPTGGTAGVTATEQARLLQTVIDNSVDRAMSNAMSGVLASVRSTIRTAMADSSPHVTTSPSGSLPTTAPVSSGQYQLRR